MYGASRLCVKVKTDSRAHRPAVRSPPVPAGTNAGRTGSAGSHGGPSGNARLRSSSGYAPFQCFQPSAPPTSKDDTGTQRHDAHGMQQDGRQSPCGDVPLQLFDIRPKWQDDRPLRHWSHPSIRRKRSSVPYVVCFIADRPAGSGSAGAAPGPPGPSDLIQSAHC